MIKRNIYKTQPTRIYATLKDVFKENLHTRNTEGK